jgi:hypothetical protein
VTPRDSQDLLDLAQEAGQLGLFEWNVSAGTLRLSSMFLSLYGLTEFDGRYETWLTSIGCPSRPGAALNDGDSP